MAWEGHMICPPALVAAGDLSTKQFYFVKLTAANTVDVCAATTDRPYGVLQNKPSAAGAAATVCTFGLSKVSGDANLAAGDQVGTSADGQAAAYTVTDTTKYIVGLVQEDNAAAGGLATIMFYGPGRVLA
jgi:hypothetical protein